MSETKNNLTDGQRDNIIAAFKGNEEMIIDSLIVMFMDMDVVEYNIITALYGGINYWAGLDETKKWKYPDGHKKRDKENETQDVYIARLILEGGAVKFYDVEESEDDSDWFLDLPKMIKGFILMMQKSPSHFSALITESGDATTSDVYIQYCLLGDIVFG